MKTITSRTNTEIKLVCDLHASKGRKEQNRFVAEGIRTCTTLIKNGMKLVQLYIVQEHQTAAQQLANSDLITIVSEPVMQKMSAATTASGILAVFAIPKQPPFAELKPGLVLAGLADPGNVGTLIRTATALNIKNVVIIEGGVDPWSPKVIQATAGTIAQITVFSCSWQALVTWKKNVRLCALVVKGGKKPQEFVDKNMLLVVGSEATGIDPTWLRDCDDFMTIPMPGRVESLNAAVAGSIALYLAFGQ